MKRILFAVAAVLIGFSAYSQEIDAGIKAGANFATLSDASGAENKTGIHAGAFAAIKYSKIAIQGELLYSQQGAETDLGDFDLDYVNIPIILKYYLVQGLNLQAGPQFGFVTKSEFEGIDADTNDFDLSGLIGAGYDMPFGLRFDARYNFGLTKVDDDSGAKNSVFTLALGYSFL